MNKGLLKIVSPRSFIKYDIFFLAYVNFVKNLFIWQLN